MKIIFFGFVNSQRKYLFKALHAIRHEHYKVAFKLNLQHI